MGWDMTKWKKICWYRLEDEVEWENLVTCSLEGRYVRTHNFVFDSPYIPDLIVDIGVCISQYEQDNLAYLSLYPNLSVRKILKMTRKGKIMTLAIDRLKRLINIVDIHYDILTKISNDLESIPVPDDLELKSSPYSILPNIGGTLKSSLVHYSMDRNDSFELYYHLHELRIWRIANLVQVLIRVLPTIEPLYDPNCVIHSKKYCSRYIPIIPSGWESVWNDCMKTLSPTETAELVGRRIIETSKCDLDLIYADLRAGIGESTWDLR